MAESKDQRRTRLKNEGKALIKEGRHSELTPQHLTAIDYFTRKNKSDTQAKSTKEKEVNAEKQTDPNSPELIRKTQETYIPSGTSSLVKGAEPSTFAEGSPLAAKPRTLKNFPNAINEDNTHHAMLGTLGDHLSSKLTEAHDSGVLHSQDAAHIDQQLTVGHQHLKKSNDAHENGDIEGAKRHMKIASDAYYGAATQMANKGVKLATTGKNVAGVAKDIAEGYINSKTPGFGAAPHENFRNIKRRDRSPIQDDSETTDKEWVQADKESNKKLEEIPRSVPFNPKGTEAGLKEAIDKKTAETMAEKENARGLARQMRAAGGSNVGFNRDADRRFNAPDAPRAPKQQISKVRKSLGPLTEFGPSGTPGVPRENVPEFTRHARIALKSLQQGAPIPAETTEALGTNALSIIKNSHMDRVKAFNEGQAK
jgi:hypothetical protein